jgi:ABC-type nitrate/sulfonate/bicarbonate transport system ATPase subunit
MAIVLSVDAVRLAGSMNALATAPPATGVVFEARKLRKVYHTGEVTVVALHGVDLQMQASELICLLGASGSGKSTLLNILGGLDVPTSATKAGRSTAPTRTP